MLDDLGCVGTEATLFDCPHTGVHNHNCVHCEDASVICLGIKAYLSFLIPLAFIFFSNL